MSRIFARQAIDTGCTIEIVQTKDWFHAHAWMDDDIAIRPGDRVTVHGAPVRLRFGESLRERRRATIERAGLLERLWTRMTARLELSELYEVSFTPGRIA